MDAQNQFLKKFSCLIQQYGEKIGENLPTTEQLEEAIMLIMAQKAEKQNAHLQKECLNTGAVEKGKIADDDVMQEVARTEALGAEKVFHTTPKTLLLDDDLHASNVDEQDYDVRKYLQQTGAPQILLPSPEQVQEYSPSRRISEMCRLLEANGLSRFVTNPLQSWLDYFLTARDNYLLFVRSHVPN